MTEPVETGKAASAERASRNGLIPFVINNLGATISSAAAFLIFVGNGYYSTLFDAFWLKPSFLSLDQVDVATTGLYATLYAFWKVARDSLRAAMLGVLIAIALPLAVAFLMWLSAWSRELVHRAVPHLDRFERIWMLTTKISAISCFALIGFVAGNVAGAQDVKYYQHERLTSHRCFGVHGTLYRGIILAQDQSRTILLHPTRVSVVRNDDLAFVRLCPRLKAR